MVRSVLLSVLSAGAQLLHRGSQVLTSAAAGASDLEQLIKRTTTEWNDDEAYGLQEAPNVFAGLREWEQSYGDFLKPGGRVGIIGCGAGRDVIALAQLGYAVEGVDISPAAIARAKEYLVTLGVPGQVYCADITDFVFPQDRYDAFIFSWYTYSYIPRSVRRIKALKNLSTKLDHDGCVIVTFISSRGRPRRASRISTWMARLTRNPNPPVIGDVFNRRLSYGHHFDREEIIEEARAADFDVASYKEGRVATAVLRLRGRRSCWRQEDGP
jgi:SAM-dependent methyltransferase